MLLQILILVAGLALLIGGADLLVRGVSALARAAGVPPLIIGLTLVAFGTSLPEVVINCLSAWKGSTGLAFGNVIGSCAVNIGFVLALTAMIRPLQVEASVIVREIPMMLLAVAGMLVLSGDRLLNHVDHNALVRGDGAILLLLFCVFLYYVIKDALTRRDEPKLQHDALVEEVERNIETGRGLVAAAGRDRPLWLSGLMSLGGLVGVAAGGRLAVAAAVSIAEALRVPQNIVGLTLVSFGTTLPELATCVVAARRGQSDIAIGNVVGSNIFNLLFIGGVVSMIRPIPIPDGGHVDLLLMAGLSAALLPVTIRGPRMVTRAEGGLLLAAYLCFVVWRTLFSR